MDSGNDSESSSIKLRKYAKNEIAGRLKMEDGSWQDVLTSDQVQSQISKVVNQLNMIEKTVGVEKFSTLRKVRITFDTRF